MASSPDYEVVTTDCPAALQNPVIFAPTVVFSSLLIRFLGGGTRGGDLVKITVLHITTSVRAPRAGAHLGAVLDDSQQQ